MNLEEEFDDIFKRRTEEAKFSFKESDWEKARKMIDKERMAEFNASPRLNYWYVSAFVLVSSIALLYFALPDNSTIALADEVIYIPETESPDKDFSILRTEEEARASSLHATANTTTSDQKIPSGDLRIIPSQSDPISPRKTSVKITLNSVSPNPQPLGREEVKEKEQNLSNHASDGYSSQPEIDKWFGENEWLTNRVSQLQRFDIEKQLSLNPIFLKRYEDDYLKKSKPKKIRSYVDAELGTSYSQGWENKGNANAKGWNGFAGFNYGHYFSKKLSFAIGAQVYSLFNVNEDFHSSTSKDYGFGSLQTQTVLTCQSMLFISFPLRVFYSLDENHKIGLGVHAGNLLTSSNTIETSQVLDGQKQNVSTVSTKGVYEGMNTRNLLLSTSFEKNIYDRISLRFELFYGISDLFNNTPSNEEKQNTSGVRLGLNFRIFKN